jgi:predicted DNA binding CopG/RHH family protein
MMSESLPTNKAETTLAVTPELQKAIRVEKAESGMTYDEYLRENLSLSVE